MSDNPYLEELFMYTTKKYNPNYGDDRMCVCGHRYIKHFEIYDRPVPRPCRNCECPEFVEQKNENP